MALAKKGRGRPSEIDRLSSEADHIVEWAKLELSQNKSFQYEIHKEFNEKLQVIDLGPVSKSAFNRHSINIAHDLRKRDEMLIIARAVSKQRDIKDIDDMTLLLSDMMKSLIHDLMGRADMSIKDTLQLARAFNAIVASEKISVTRKRDMTKKLEAGVDQALETVSREKGLTKEQAETIKREVLGLKK